MKFIVRNRDDVEVNGVGLTEDYVMISISCPSDPANLKRDVYLKHLIRLEFDDVDVPVTTPVKLFNQQNAKDILAFYRRYQDKYNYLVVHCDAGISRSPAVAGALSKIHTGNDKEFFDKYLPNRRVYTKILSEYYEDE